MFIQGKISEPFFKKFSIIDTWKFCNSDDVIYEIIDELAKIFLNDEEMKKESVYKDFFSRIIKELKLNKKALLGAIEFKLGLSIKELLSISVNSDKYFKNRENIEITEQQEKINNAIKNPPLTIIFFDNIERLGSYSWTMIKIIQKLSMINNLILIFPINKNKLHSLDHSNDENYELNIDKYIQLPFYKLEQDYLGVLNKINIKKDYIQIINNILIKDINGYNMSVRKVLSSFKHLNVKGKINESKHKGLILIKQIWDPIIDGNKNIIDELIIEDIRGFSKYASFLEKWHKETSEIIINNGFISMIGKEYKYYYDINNNWIESINLIKIYNQKHIMENWKNFIYDWKKSLEQMLIFFDDIYSHNKKKLVKKIKKSKISPKKLIQ